MAVVHGPSVSGTNAVTPRKGVERTCFIAANQLLIGDTVQDMHTFATKPSEASEIDLIAALADLQKQQTALRDRVETRFIQELERVIQTLNVISGMEGVVRANTLDHAIRLLKVLPVVVDSMKAVNARKGTK